MNEVEKSYAILIAVIIILVFLFAFFYYSNFNLKRPVNTNGNTLSGSNPTAEGASNKTFGFDSASCTVANNADVLRFKIQNGPTGFNQGEISAYLDNSLASFKDSAGTSIDSTALSPNSISNEFSYTTTNHQASRKITIAIPTGSFDKILTCS